MILDLFAGPGGWSEGLRMLGHDDIGVEWDASACATRAAAGHRTIRADVAQLPVPTWRAPAVEGLIGSPPCQAFSNAGQRKGFDDIEHLFAHVHACQAGWREFVPYPWSDPRTALVLEPLRWVDGLVPRWVALEQVPPVLPLWEAMAGVLRGWGYSVWTGVLNAADYGVPQTRQRAILIAARDRAVHPPEPTHARNPAPSLFGAQLKPWVSMAEALGWCGKVGFPRRDDRGDSPDGYRERDWRSTDEPAFAVTEKDRSWVVRTGANTMKHSRNPDEVELYERPIDEPAPTVDAKAGSAWSVRTNNFTGARGEDGERTNYERPVDEPAPTVGSRGDLWTLHTNRGQDADGNRQTRGASAPAPALTAKAGGQWVFDRPATTVAGDPRVWAPGHKENADDPPGVYQQRRGDQAIRVSIREGLILQGFRPDYPVLGTRTKQWEQVGNAVPPPLASAVLRGLVEVRGA